VRALFEHLRSKDVDIALASPAKEDELEVYKKAADIEDLIDEQTSSDDAESSKPNPDIFLAALDRLSKPDPEDVIVVGDTPYDAEAASKAGLRTIGMLCGGFPEDGLRRPSHLIGRKTANLQKECRTRCKTLLQWKVHGQQCSTTRK